MALCYFAVFSFYTTTNDRLSFVPLCNNILYSIMFMPFQCLLDSKMVNIHVLCFDSLPPPFSEVVQDLHSYFHFYDCRNDHRQHLYNN